VGGGVVVAGDGEKGKEEEEVVDSSLPAVGQLML